MEPRILVRPVALSDEEPFLAAVRRSRSLHAPWITPPSTPEAFAAHVASFKPPASHGFVAVTADTGELVGAIQITNVILGVFRSGYLSYYAFSGWERRGLMKEALRAVCRKAFRELKLHRLEANMQPENRASIALVRSCGFQREGYSPRYLKIRGRWRDHERWAILADSGRGSFGGQRR